MISDLWDFGNEHPALLIPADVLSIVVWVLTANPWLGLMALWLVARAFARR